MKANYKIRILREYLGLSQAQMAADIGTSRGNITNIEGDRVTPTPLLLTCISAVYHVDRDWLMDELIEGNVADYIMEDPVVREITELVRTLDTHHKECAKKQIEALKELQEKEILS